MVAQLTYNIVEERLNGELGAKHIDCRAGSGGRAGTITKGAVNWYLQNNALATHVHSGAHQFGPLPQGFYWMHPHENKKNKIRLEPFPENQMFRRSAFEIHGRGEEGSHGCIVPYDHNSLLQICAAVHNYIGVYHKNPVLEVIAVGTDVDLKFRTA